MKPHTTRQFKIGNSLEPSRAYSQKVCAVFGQEYALAVLISYKIEMSVFYQDIRICYICTIWTRQRHYGHMKNDSVTCRDNQLTNYQFLTQNHQYGGFWQPLGSHEIYICL